MTRALVTNDDGIDSVGLRTLASVAVDAGLEVTVAAPSWNASGASASLAAVQDQGRFLIEERSWDDVAVRAAVAVEAAPAFIVQAAISGAFGPPPDMVLSGINDGPNTGHAVLHSGTVGAALTAATHGRRALAVSIGTGTPTHWSTAAHITGIALGWLLDADEATVLNINIPNLALDDVGGFERATLAASGAVQATITDTGTGYVTLAYHDVDATLEAGTDAALLAAGIATFTPLRAVCEATAHDTSRLGGMEARPGGGTRSRPEDP